MASAAAVINSQRQGSSRITTDSIGKVLNLVSTRSICNTVPVIAVTGSYCTGSTRSAVVDGEVQRFCAVATGSVGEMLNLVTACCISSAVPYIVVTTGCRMASAAAVV